jgi:nucleolar protein 56
MADIGALRKRLIARAKGNVKQAYAGRELHIVRAVAVLRDLDDVSNLLYEDCNEWHHLFFPELENLVRDNQTYLKLVHLLGEREKFTEETANEIVGNKELAAKIAAKAKESMGGENPAALKEVQLLALNALNLKEERKYIEKFIEGEIKAIAPNFAELCGAVLAARMLTEAGGLQRLATMPSSTLQLLGAEKALFRHLRNRQAKGPKYGFLYQHALVKTLPAKNKGKMARTIAGKLSIAAKADYFGKGSPVHKKLRESLERRHAELAK